MHGEGSAKTMVQLLDYLFLLFSPEKRMYLNLGIHQVVVDPEC